MDDIPSQRSLFSDDPETLGFDLSAGNVWVYPENYPTREYQFAIVKKSLYRNTLVCLPTGLGKTFIAAVLMYNFWRWYPKGKVVFLAPTKPLVAQQINACHEIMGIPSEETIELTGTTNQKLREVAWMNKRVIFATPQTFHKDLEKNIFPLNMVKCLVIDEAHKALGKHSYCESVRLLSEQNKFFRVLALSATPGDKIAKVVEVITNLHISNLELRDDMSPDITPYINERKFDIILVRLSDELARFKERYISVMDPHVRFLVRCNVLRGDTGNITRGRIFHLLRDFQAKPNKSGNYGQIMKTLNILQTMYHAYELMIRHGLRAFMHFYENHNDKRWLAQEINLHEMLKDIKNYLGPFPVIEPLSDGTIPDVSNDILFGHNKFYKLKELLEKHFKSFQDKNEETRAIVFVEFRDIVNEVYVLLLQSRPLIRPQMFVGQAGQKRRQQIEALENFRSNIVNVLISTSVGEEGLDVGEVDLIICFDMSQSSPIRLVQRMGRTGRKRDGRIIALVTDGKELESLKSTMSKKDSLNSKVLQSSAINSALYEQSPRMIPNQFTPDCRKMHMKVLTKTPKVKGASKRKEILNPKRKTTETRLIEKEPGAKNTGQSSIQNFFKTTKPGERMSEYNNYACSQTQQNISIKDVNLYFSDKESEEFLTLCAIRKTRTDSHILNFETNEKYFRTKQKNPSKDLSFLRNLVIPNLNDKDYVKAIPEVRESSEETIHELPNSQIHSQNFPSVSYYNEYDNHNDIDNDNENLYSTYFTAGEVTIERSFLDLIYDSSSSEELENFHDDNLPNKFEVTCNFDDLLETTDESEPEVEMEMQMEMGDLKTEIKDESNSMDIEEENQNLCDKNNLEEERKVMFNFTDILEDSSLDSIKSQNSDKNAEVIERNVIEKIVEQQEKETISLNLRNENEIPPRTKSLSPEGREYNFSNLLGGTTLDSLNTQDFVRTQSLKNSKEIPSVPVKEKISPDGIQSRNSAQDKKETVINASHLLGGMSLDCINTQDLLNPVILSNKNPSTQENVSRNNSILTLSTNTSGITITQVIEEIGKINGNKSFNNNNLKVSSSLSITENQRIEDQKIENQRMENQRIENQRIENYQTTRNEEKNISTIKDDKQMVYEILDSDEDLFNTEFDDISIIASNVPEPGKTPNKSNQFENIPKGNTLTIGNLAITKLNQKENSDKLPINEKKNSDIVISFTSNDNLSKENEISKTNISRRKKLTFGDLDISTVSPVKSTPIERENLKNFNEKAKTIEQRKKLTIGNLEISTVKPNKSSLPEKRGTNKFSLNEKGKEISTLNPEKSINSERGNSSKISLNEKGNSCKLSLNKTGNSIQVSLNEKGNLSEVSFNEKDVSSTFFLNEKGNSRFSLNETGATSDKKNSKSNKEKESFDNNSNSKGENSKANEKENSRFSFGIINDVDWDSDFEVLASEVNTTKYFKQNEQQKTLPPTTNVTKIPPEVTNPENKNISKPEKKFSLFKRNKPFSLLQDSSEENQVTNNSSRSNEVNLLSRNKPFSLRQDSTEKNQIPNNSSKQNEEKTAEILSKRSKPFSLRQDSTEKNQTPNQSSKQTEVNSEEIFKKPDLNSFKRVHINSPSTSSDRKNRQSKLSLKLTEKREMNREVSFNSTSTESPEVKRKKIKKRRPDCQFIDNEADVSDDDYNTSDGSSGEDDDDDLQDFVSYTQNTTQHEDMRAHYMKSVRSPIRRPGAFLIKKSSHFHGNVFSQPLSQYDDTYVQDSFCVNEDESEYNEENSDVDEDLEIIAENLSEVTLNRGKRKRKRSPIFKCNKRKKRKGRIQNLYNNNSSSSDDETEQLRKQIQNESVFLKK
ncbi:protein PFC0760c [Leptopilina heterotoma]|uniref:protein PFC0760c n=1 Tax=Leptopilina heterotoma TaxID=63436 RepID=UPI001CA8A1F2|nr:protein PFC0760c [Leptopilina heterotoma]XP_043481440.1 protein PFC0760c [Leptopilina heterotoma]